jgi:hypothetical protein
LLWAKESSFVDCAYCLWCRWFYRGQDRWQLFSSLDNITLETAYKNGTETVRLNGSQDQVNFQERIMYNPDGTKRSVTRGTYVSIFGAELFPVDESMVEILEQYFHSGQYNIPVVSPDKRYEVVIKSPDDIRHYEIGSTDYIPVQRGYRGK